MRLKAVAVSILIALASPAFAADTTARQLAQDAIIVDTHIDAPGGLMSHWADLGKASPKFEFDYPRARDGGLDVAFMSIYTSAKQDADGSARQVAHEMIDAVEALAVRAAAFSEGCRAPAPGRTRAAAAGHGKRRTDRR